MEYGLIGEKLSHSFSPILHSYIGDYDYQLKEICREDISEFLNSASFKGINVTIPYKQTVMEHLDYISEDAKMIGAVNTIVNRGGKLYGYNTDFTGLRALIIKSGVNTANKKALILGTGGTSNTAEAVLRNLRCSDVLKVSRRPDSSSVSYDDVIRHHADAEIIINTTPVGMYPNCVGTPIQLDCFNNIKAVFDVVYNPLRTDLIIDAQMRNIPAYGGLYMLASQAVAASELFFDRQYDKNVFESVYKAVLNNKVNIVLTGMPGCGKSTIGKILAHRTGMEFIDTDEIIVSEYGKTITDIFSEVGESGFRKIEADVIGRISEKNHCVISTGGGAVLSERNIINLMHNGCVFFLDRPLDELLPTPDRPLASSHEDIIRRYNERIEKYRSLCDTTVSVVGPEATADLIIKCFREMY